MQFIPSLSLSLFLPTHLFHLTSIALLLVATNSMVGRDNRDVGHAHCQRRPAGALWKIWHWVKKYKYSLRIRMGSPVLPWVHVVFCNSASPVVLIPSHSLRAQSGEGVWLFYVLKPQNWPLLNPFLRQSLHVCFNQLLLWGHCNLKRGSFPSPLGLPFQ